MNKLSPSKEELLLRYLDGELSEVEKKILITEIERSAELKQRLTELNAVRTFLVRKPHLDEPSKNFTQRVMAGLDRKPATAIGSYKNGLYLLLGIIIASAIAVMLLLNGVFDENSTSIVIDATRIQNKWITPSALTIPFNAKIVVNGIIFLNLGIALILFDRTILKPFFQKRMMMS